MKVKNILLLALFLLPALLHAQRIKGSDTVLPVARQTTECFLYLHSEAHATVTGGGTGVGIAALIDNNTDIAMASRPIKPGEKKRAKAAGATIEEVGLAYVSPLVKTLAISYDDDGRYTLPGIENALNKTYPIVRPLYYYYKAENRDAVAPLLRFILSAEGQDIIKKSGYIPAN